jgi:hypothetical protein
MFPTGFQTSIPSSERAQSNALDRKVTGIASFRYAKHRQKDRQYTFHIISLENIVRINVQ